MEKSGFCPYCCKSVDNLTEEHVVPALIGGNLTIRACSPCNEGAARHVDNPMLAFGDVKLLKAFYDVRSVRARTKWVATQFAGVLSGTGGGVALYRPGADEDLVQRTVGEPAVRRRKLHRRHTS